MRKQDGKYCVYNKSTGENKGCSATRDEAVKHMRLLYGIENGSVQTKSFDGYVYEYQVSQDMANYNPVGGGNEKACANCFNWNSPDGCLLVQGDISPTGICGLWRKQEEYTAPPIQVEVTNWMDAATKAFECKCESCEVLVLGFKAVWTTQYINDLPDSAFAYIEPGGTKDEKGRTQGNKRHFPIRDSSGQLDRAHVINAEQRASQSPFGSKAIPKIRAAMRSLGIQSAVKAVKDFILGPPDPPVGLRPIYLHDDPTTGDLRAMVVFSNNFEDRHDQINPRAVQDEYVDWVEQTKLYPEYQMWHLGAKSRWGQADIVTKIGNFVIADGPVDPGMEEVAEAFANDPNTGTSNGYYAAYTIDKKEFLAWYPFEISPLPLSESANVWHGAQESLIQEGYLMKDEHKSFLEAHGVKSEMIDAIEKDILARQKNISAQGVASKAVEPEPEPSPDPTPTPEPGPDQKVIDSIATAFNKALSPINDRLVALEEGQKALNKTKDDTVADAILARVGALPQGYKGTESNPAPTPTQNPDDSLDHQFDWLGAEIDKALKAGGVS